MFQLCAPDHEYSHDFLHPLLPASVRLGRVCRRTLSARVERRREV